MKTLYNCNCGSCNKGTDKETTKKVFCNVRQIYLDGGKRRSCGDYGPRPHVPSRYCRVIKTQSGEIKTVWIAAEMLVRRYLPRKCRPSQAPAPAGSPAVGPAEAKA